MKSIEQVITFAATPEQIYEALMDSAKHAAFSGAPARISREVGGPVSCYDGFISAINVELVKNQRVVQAWRGKDWAEGVYSIATFALEPAGKQTQVTFTQHGVPDDKASHIADGWKAQYWDKLSAYLAKA